MVSDDVIVYISDGRGYVKVRSLANIILTSLFYSPILPECETILPVW